MKLQKRVLALAVASALVAPNALAVEGSDGMYYTSASEGLYASIRARFNTADTDGGGSGIVDDAGSNIGIQGFGEMAGGLEMFYRYELSVPDTGDDIHSGKSFVGLRGNFGEVRLGAHDLVEHDYVTAKTDFTNNGNRPSGAHNIPNNRALHYKSPDFNGLQVGAGFHLPQRDEVPVAMQGIGGAVGDAKKPTSDLAAWTLAGNYAFQGFAVGAAYGVTGDDLIVRNASDEVTGFEDKTSWGIGASYGQDNWTVATFYKSTNMGDQGADFEDQVGFSVGGTVNVGATKIIVTHDSVENNNGVKSQGDGTASTFEVEYHLNSKAKVWVGYTASDFDYDATVEDDFYVGLRHDF